MFRVYRNLMFMRLVYNNLIFLCLVYSNPDTSDFSKCMLCYTPAV